jgi:hypothetical protein
MDFSFDQEQLSYKKSVLEFAKNELDRDVIPLDRESEFDHDALRSVPGLAFKACPSLSSTAAARPIL